MSRIYFTIPTRSSYVEKVVSIPRDDSPNEEETFQVVITKSRVFGNVIFTVASDFINTHTTVGKWGVTEDIPDSLIKLHSDTLKKDVCFNLSVHSKEYTLRIDF